MFDAIRNAAVLGGLALCVTLVLGSKRRAVWALGITLVTFAASIALGVVEIGSATLLASNVSWSAVSKLFAWSVLAALLFAVGGVRGIGSPISGAFIGGLAFGGLASGLALANQHDEANAKARIVLAASAASLAGPLGTECALLFDVHLQFGGAITLAIALAFIGAWPARMTAKMERVGDPLALVLAVVVFIVAWWFPTVGLGIAVASLLIVAAAKRALDERASVRLTPETRAGRFTWWACVVAVMLLMTPAGVIGFTLESLPEMQRFVGRWTPEMTGAITVIWTSLGSALPIALFGFQALELDPFVFNQETWRAILATAAIGTGGAGLILCGKDTFVAGWRRWALQIIVLFLAIQQGWFA